MPTVGANAGVTGTQLINIINAHHEELMKKFDLLFSLQSLHGGAATVPPQMPAQLVLPPLTLLPSATGVSLEGQQFSSEEKEIEPPGEASEERSRSKASKDDSDRSSKLSWSSMPSTEAPETPAAGHDSTALGRFTMSGAQALKNVMRGPQSVSERASHFFMSSMATSDFDEEEERRHRARRRTMVGNISGALMERRHRKDKLKRASCWRKMLQRIVASESFEALFAFLIVVNSALIGLEVEFSQKTYSAHNHWKVMFHVFNLFFAAVFFVELMMRLGAAGLQGFFASEQGVTWNIFDCFLVASSALEIAVEALQGDDGGVGSTRDRLESIRLIRVVRICRLLRLLRLARLLHTVRALRVLVFSIFSTLKSLIWSMILLFMIIYAFSIIFTQTVSDYFMDTDTSPDHDHLHDCWSTVGKSMLTLYLVVTNGMDWKELIGPLHRVDPHLVVILMVFISFTYFAVLNVVTGVFCQTAMENAQNDRDLMMQSLLSDREQFIEKVKQQFSDMFTVFDDEGKLGVSFREFESHINEPSVQAYLALLELNTSDAWSLFQLLGDENSAHTVDAEDFVDGCLRLKGSARSIDLALLRKESRVQVKRLREHLQSDIQIIMQKLSTVDTDVTHLKMLGFTTLDRVQRNQCESHLPPQPGAAHGTLPSPEFEERPPQPQIGHVFFPGESLFMPSGKTAL